MPQEDKTTIGGVMARREQEDVELSQDTFSNNLEKNVNEFIGGLGHIISSFADGAKLWWNDPKDASRLLFSEASGNLVGDMVKTQLGIWGQAIKDPVAYLHNHPLDAFLDILSVFPAAGGAAKGIGALHDMGTVSKISKGLMTAEEIAALTGRSRTAANLYSLGSKIERAPLSLAKMALVDTPSRLFQRLTPVVNVAGEEITLGKLFMRNLGIDPFSPMGKLGNELGLELRHAKSAKQAELLEELYGAKGLAKERRDLLTRAIGGELGADEIAAAKLTDKERGLMQAYREMVWGNEMDLKLKGFDPDTLEITKYSRAVQNNPDIWKRVSTPGVLSGAGQDVIEAIGEWSKRRASLGLVGEFGPEDLQRFNLMPKPLQKALVRVAKEISPDATYYHLIKKTPRGFFQWVAQMFTKGERRGMSAPTGQLKKRVGLDNYETDFARIAANQADIMSTIHALEQTLPSLIEKARPAGARMVRNLGEIDWTRETLLPVGMLQEFHEAVAKNMARTGAVTQDAEWFVKQLGEIRRIANEGEPGALRYLQALDRGGGVDLPKGFYAIPKDAAMALLTSVAPSGPWWFRAFNRATDFTKLMILSFSLPFHLGNIVGSSFLHWVSGGNLGGMRRATMKKFMDFAPDYIRQTMINQADISGKMMYEGGTRLGAFLERMTRATQGFENFLKRSSWLSNVEKQVIAQKFGRVFGRFRVMAMSLDQVDELVYRAIRSAGEYKSSERVLAATKIKLEELVAQREDLVAQLAQQAPGSMPPDALVTFRQRQRHIAQEIENLEQVVIPEAMAQREVILKMFDEGPQSPGATVLEESKREKFLKHQRALAGVDDEVKQATAALEAYQVEHANLLAKIKEWRGDPARGIPGIRTAQGEAVFDQVNKLVSLEGRISELQGAVQRISSGALKGEDVVQIRLGKMKTGLEKMLGEAKLLENKLSGQIQASQLKTMLAQERSRRMAQAGMGRAREQVLAAEKRRESLMGMMEHDMNQQFAQSERTLQDAKDRLGWLKEREARNAKRLGEKQGEQVAENILVEQAERNIRDLDMQEAALRRTLADSERVLAAPDTVESVRAVHEAMDHTEKFFYDYLRLSYPERTLVRTLIPFWGWYKNISKLMYSLPIISPKRSLLYHAWAQMAVDLYDEPSKPDFLANYIPIGVDRDGGQLWASLDYLNPMTGSITYSASEWAGRINPLIKLGIEWASGRAIFTQKPTDIDAIRGFDGRLYEYDGIQGVIRPRRPFDTADIPQTAIRYLESFKPFRVMRQVLRSYSLADEESGPDWAAKLDENGRMLLGTDTLALLKSAGGSILKEDQADFLGNMDGIMRRKIGREARKELRNLARRDDPDAAERRLFLRKIIEHLGTGEVVMSRQ